MRDYIYTITFVCIRTVSYSAKSSDAALSGLVRRNRSWRPLAGVFSSGGVVARKTKAEAERTRLQIIEAARNAFHLYGVSGTTMERIADIAGVSRGAVYWHFENKAAVFFAMHDEWVRQMEFVRDILLSSDIANPLDAIERSLLALIDVLENNEAVRQSFEIMSLRCEYVNEFASVLQEVNRPCLGYIENLESVYARAAQQGYLRPGLDPKVLAYDTLTFTTGLFNNWLAAEPGDLLRREVRAMIRGHVALRRECVAAGRCVAMA